MSNTIFGQIARGEVPTELLYEDEHALAFYDIAPQAPTHILIIPRKAIAKLSDAEDSDTELLGHLLQVARRVATEQGLEDFRLVVNNGAGSGQTVFHLHIHLLGGRSLQWPPG